MSEKTRRIRAKLRKIIAILVSIIVVFSNFLGLGVGADNSAASASAGTEYTQTLNSEDTQAESTSVVTEAIRAASARFASPAFASGHTPTQFADSNVKFTAPASDYIVVNATFEQVKSNKGITISDGAGKVTHDTKFIVNVIDIPADGTNSIRLGVNFAQWQNANDITVDSDNVVWNFVGEGSFSIAGGSFGDSVYAVDADVSVARSFKGDVYSDSVSAKSLSYDNSFTALSEVSDGSSDAGSDGSSDDGSDGSSDAGSDGSSDGGSDGSSDESSDGSSDDGSDGSSDDSGDGSSDAGSDDGSGDADDDDSDDSGDDGSDDAGDDGDNDTAAPPDDDDDTAAPPPGTDIEVIDKAGEADKIKAEDTDKYNEAAKKHNDAVAAHNQDVKDFELKIADFNKRVAEYNKRADAYEVELAEYKKHLADKDLTYTVEQDKYDALKVSCDALNADYSKLKKELAELEVAKDTLEKASAKYNKEKGDLELQYAVQPKDDRDPWTEEQWADYWEAKHNYETFDMDKYERDLKAFEDFDFETYNALHAKYDEFKASHPELDLSKFEDLSVNWETFDPDKFDEQFAEYLSEMDKYNSDEAQYKTDSAELEALKTKYKEFQDKHPELKLEDFEDSSFNWETFDPADFDKLFDKYLDDLAKYNTGEAQYETDSAELEALEDEFKAWENKNKDAWDNVVPDPTLEWKDFDSEAFETAYEKYIDDLAKYNTDEAQYETDSPRLQALQTKYEEFQKKHPELNLPDFEDSSINWETFDPADFDNQFTKYLEDLAKYNTDKAKYDEDFKTYDDLSKAFEAFSDANKDAWDNVSVNKDIDPATFDMEAFAQKFNDYVTDLAKYNTDKAKSDEDLTKYNDLLAEFDAFRIANPDAWKLVVTDDTIDPATFDPVAFAQTFDDYVKGLADYNTDMAKYDEDFAKYKVLFDEFGAFELANPDAWKDVVQDPTLEWKDFDPVAFAQTFNDYVNGLADYNTDMADYNKAHTEYTNLDTAFKAFAEANQDAWKNVPVNKDIDPATFDLEAFAQKFNDYVTDLADYNTDKAKYDDLVKKYGEFQESHPELNLPDFEDSSVNWKTFDPADFDNQFTKYLEDLADYNTKQAQYVADNEKYNDLNDAFLAFAGANQDAWNNVHVSEDIDPATFDLEAFVTAYNTYLGDLAEYNTKQAQYDTDFPKWDDLDKAFRAFRDANPGIDLTKIVDPSLNWEDFDRAEFESRLETYKNDAAALDSFNTKYADFMAKHPGFDWNAWIPTSAAEVPDWKTFDWNGLETAWEKYDAYWSTHDAGDYDKSLAAANQAALDNYIIITHGDVNRDIVALTAAGADAATAQRNYINAVYTKGEVATTGTSWVANGQLFNGNSDQTRPGTDAGTIEGYFELAKFKSAAYASGQNTATGEVYNTAATTGDGRYVLKAGINVINLERFPADGAVNVTYADGANKDNAKVVVNIRDSGSISITHLNLKENGATKYDRGYQVTWNFINAADISLSGTAMAGAGVAANYDLDGNILAPNAKVTINSNRYGDTYVHGRIIADSVAGRGIVKALSETGTEAVPPPPAPTTFPAPSVLKVPELPPLVKPDPPVAPEIPELTPPDPPPTPVKPKIPHLVEPDPPVPPEIPELKDVPKPTPPDKPHVPILHEPVKPDPPVPPHVPKPEPPPDVLPPVAPEIPELHKPDPPPTPDTPKIPELPDIPPPVPPAPPVIPELPDIPPPVPPAPPVIPELPDIPPPIPPAPPVIPVEPTPPEPPHKPFPPPTPPNKPIPPIGAETPGALAAPVTVKPPEGDWKPGDDDDDGDDDDGDDDDDDDILGTYGEESLEYGNTPPEASVTLGGGEEEYLPEPPPVPLIDFPPEPEYVPDVPPVPLIDFPPEPDIPRVPAPHTGVTQDNGTAAALGIAGAVAVAAGVVVGRKKRENE